MVFPREIFYKEQDIKFKNAPKSVTIWNEDSFKNVNFEYVLFEAQIKWVDNTEPKILKESPLRRLKNVKNN